MHAAVNIQNLTGKEKQAYIFLIDSIALNSLLTGIELRIQQIIRASDHNNNITTFSRIKCKLHLHYLETQKISTNRYISQTIRKLHPQTFVNQCSFCKQRCTSLTNAKSRPIKTTTQMLDQIHFSKQVTYLFF